MRFHAQSRTDLAHTDPSPPKPSCFPLSQQQPGQAVPRQNHKVLNIQVLNIHFLGCCSSSPAATERGSKLGMWLVRPVLPWVSRAQDNTWVTLPAEHGPWLAWLPHSCCQGVLSQGLRMW